jgi:hypothetical protein
MQVAIFQGYVMLLRNEMPPSRTSFQVAEDSDLLEEVRNLQAAIKACPYSAVRQLRCESVDGKLAVAGRLPSFFLKQVAIELIRRQACDGGRFDQAIDVE